MARSSRATTKSGDLIVRGSGSLKRFKPGCAYPAFNWAKSILRADREALVVKVYSDFGRFNVRRNTGFSSFSDWYYHDM